MWTGKDMCTCGHVDSDHCIKEFPHTLDDGVTIGLAGLGSCLHHGEVRKGTDNTIIWECPCTKFEKVEEDK